MTLVFFAIVVTAGLVGFSSYEGLLAWDVRFAYLPAAEAVLDGRSPYPKQTARSSKSIEDHLYAAAPLRSAALSVLPVGVAAVLVAQRCSGSRCHPLGSQVRDVRCYAAAVLWVPSVSEVLLSNVSIPLAFALAVLWRYRDAVWPPALALGISVSAKLLFWPMFVWMLATRRLRAAALAILIGVVLTAAAWSAIGFDGLSGYPDLLRRLSDIQAERSCSIVGMAAGLGLSESVGQVLTLALEVPFWRPRGARPA